MKLSLALVLLQLSAAGFAADPPPLQTPLEAAAHARISQSAEMSAFLAALAARAPELVKVESIGKSVQGRALEVVRFSLPHKVKTAPRLKVMVIGTQHGAAEPAGGEALLVIARDLALGDLRPLLEDLDILLLPNANPDGRDLRRRSNANQININTDFVLVTQPETRLLKEAIARYRPDTLLDSHESAVLKRKTLATEGYLTDFDAQFEISNNPAVPVGLRDYALQTFLPAVTARVSAGGLPAYRSIGEITTTRQPITNGGLTLRNFRNTAGMTGALSLLVETKLDSREEKYPTYRNIAVRVERQLLCIRSYLALAHERREEIRQITSRARAVLSKEALTMFAGYEVDHDHPTARIPMRRLDTGKLEELEFRDHRRQVNADVVPFPPMLVITRHQDRLRPLLERHGIQYWSVAQATAADVIAARFKPRANIYYRAVVRAETRRSLDIEAGGLLIDLAQPSGRTAALLLDPRATSSVFRYPEFAALVVPDEDFFVYRTFKGTTRSQP